MGIHVGSCAIDAFPFYVVQEYLCPVHAATPSLPVALTRRLNAAAFEKTTTDKMVETFLSLFFVSLQLIRLNTETCSPPPPPKTNVQTANQLQRYFLARPLINSDGMEAASKSLQKSDGVMGNL